MNRNGFQGAIIFTNDLSHVLDMHTNKYAKGAIFDMYNEASYGQYYSNGVISLSFLMPPYEAAAELINGNPVGFESIYSSYLRSPNVMTNITRILKLIFVGYDVYVFVPYNVIEFGYDKFVLTHLFNDFGVQCEAANVPFAINPVYCIQNYDLMYLYGAFSKEEYCSLDIFHRNIPKQIIDKLAVEYNLTNVNEINAFISKLQNRPSVQNLQPMFSSVNEGV